MTDKKGTLGRIQRIICLIIAGALMTALFACSAPSEGPEEGENPAEAEDLPEEPADLSALEAEIAAAEAMDVSGSLSGGYLLSATAEAKALASKENVSQTEVDKMTQKLKAAEEGQFYHGDFPDPGEITATHELMDPFQYVDGSFVKTKEEWVKRAAEISAMYQHYMYGVWRDGSDEELTYELTKGEGSAYSLKMNITRISTGATTTVSATVNVPDSSIEAPEGGYPVIVGMHQGISEDVALKNGYATATLDFFGYGVASDDTKHTGAFYDLYPYGTEPEEQTGVLMAWGWGCSKIVDALEAGLGEELNISPVNTIVTGVSRWGKAAIVCGAFDRRFKMVAPSCSGAGGVALYRYVSEGKTYDFSSKGADSAYTYGQNEPLGSLQSSAERGWFNDMFLKFKTADSLPLDQHLLCSLVAEPDRYLFIIGSCIYEDWVNAPAMWYAYKGAKVVFDALDLGENIAINIHQQGHAVIPEDIEYITDYFDYHVYGKEPDHDLEDLKTSVFALEGNADGDMADIGEYWLAP